MTGVPVRVLRAGVALALVALAAPGGVPAVAATRPLTATVTQVQPLLPTAAGPITLTLQLANTGDEAVSGITAVMTTSLDPLAGRSRIPSIESGAYTPTYRNADATGVSGVDLADGTTSVVTLTATPQQLGLSTSRPGVYTIGATVSGTLESGRRTTLHTQTLLPWMPRNPYASTLRVAPIWTLSAPPSRALDGTLVSNVLARALLPGGRLREQLDAFTTVPNATWLVDPLVLETVADLADGIDIREGEDTREATDEERDAASTWLADLAQQSANAYVAAMPVASLDVRGALQDGHAQLAKTAIAQARQRLINALPGVDVHLAVPIQGGSVSTRTWRWLNTLGVELVVTSDTAYGAQTQTYTPSSLMWVNEFASRPVLVTDTSLADGLRSTTARTIGSDQRFAAELLITYLERPNSDRVIAVNPAMSWDPRLTPGGSGLWDAPWLTTLTTPQAWSVGETAERNARNSDNVNMTKRRQQVIARALGRQEFLTHLTGDADFHGGIRDAIMALGSRWWTVGAARDDYSTPTLELLRSYTQAVQIVTQGDIVFGGETGVTPVTVANLLPVPVDVTLIASGIPSVRVTAREQTPLRLNAGKRVSVEVPTSVYGSGAAYLLLQLQTSDGTGVGLPTMLTVRSAAYARVASYLVAGAFVMLLLLIFVNTIRRVRVRKHGRDEGDGGE